MIKLKEDKPINFSHDIFQRGDTICFSQISNEVNSYLYLRKLKDEGIFVNILDMKSYSTYSIATNRIYSIENEKDRESDYCIFTILYFIFIINKLFGSNHNDLSLNNILMTNKEVLFSTYNKVSYNVGGKKYLFQLPKTVPIIIDFEFMQKFTYPRVLNYDVVTEAYEAICVRDTRGMSDVFQYLTSMKMVGFRWRDLFEYFFHDVSGEDVEMNYQNRIKEERLGSKVRRVLDEKSFENLFGRYESEIMVDDVFEHMKFE